VGTDPVLAVVPLRSPVRTSQSPATPPSPARTRSPCGLSSAGCGSRQVRNWRCSRHGTSRRSSPTGPGTWWRSRSTTVATRSSSNASPSSSLPASPAHLPSGGFMANAAWLALTVIATTWAEPSDASLEAVWPRSQRPPCNGGSSPPPGSSSETDDADNYGYQRPGPGHTPSTKPSSGSTRSHSAADDDAPPRPSGPRRRRQFGSPGTPSTENVPFTPHFNRRRPNRVSPWIRATCAITGRPCVATGCLPWLRALR
jgi:hypothetical protein